MFQAFFVDPFVMIYDAPLFFVEVLVSGLMAGVMYALVALGFVLIYKASGVFNFAQGAMVLFAALTFVGLWELGVNPWLALILAALVMIGVAFTVERVVLRPLVNQDPIIFFHGHNRHNVFSGWFWSDYLGQRGTSSGHWYSQ